MSGIRRLTQETRSPVARALLESADADRAPGGACDRALDALGVGTVGAVSTSAAAKAAGAGGTGGAKAAGASGIASTAAKGGGLLFAKWSGVALLGGAVALGSTGTIPRVLTRSAPSERTSLVPTRQTDLLADRPRVLPVSPPLAPADSEVVVPPPLVASSAPARSAEVPRTARPPTPAPHPPEPAGPETPAVDPIAKQLEALSGIRAVESSAPGRALMLLDEFDRRHPASPLQEEATVLRIDALVDTGRMAEARTMAAAFSQAYPASAYTRHVRSKVKSP